MRRMALAAVALAALVLEIEREEMVAITVAVVAEPRLATQAPALQGPEPKAL